MSKLVSLQELVDLLNRLKIRQLRTLGNSDDHDKTLTGELYDLIIDRKIEDEEEISKYFFEGKKHGRQYSRRLIKKLKHRLLPMLFHIDLNQPSYNDIQRAFYSVQRNYALVQILLGKGARNAAIELAEETIGAGLKFGFTAINVELARNLSYHFSLLNPDSRKSKFYTKTLRNQKEILEAEHEIEAFYIEVFKSEVESRATTGSSSNISEERLNSIFTRVRNLLDKFTSNRLDNFGFQLLLFKYEIASDHINVIKSSNEAIDRANKRKGGASSALVYNYSSRIITSSIILKRYEDAERAIAFAYGAIPNGARNWFIIRELHLILFFHNRNWQKAYQHLVDTFNNEGFKRQPAVIREQWIVYKGYVQYLITIGQIQPEGEGNPKSFRIGKFLNEVPIYSRDKRGTNISIIIIQLLFLLQKRQFDKYIDRVDALRMYAHRYLRKDETYRSNCFIQMMLQIPKANFNRIMALRKADKYWKRLLEVPLEKAKQGGEVEIIPYETLWSFALQSLDEKPRRTRIG